jgi:hypothetical protein
LRTALKDWRRPLLVLGLAAYGLSLTWGLFHRFPHARGDISWVWSGAQAVLHGSDPYSAVGPGREYNFPTSLWYPLPAILAMVPFAWLSMNGATIAFGTIGAGALAVALTCERIANPQLLVFASWSYLFAVITAQWSPLLTAAGLLPALGWLLVCKPPIGLAMFAGWPRRAAVIGGLVFIVISVIVQPRWPVSWLGAIADQQHMLPPVTRPFGFLILLGLLRWRRPEARVLVTLGCLPHTVSPYETIPLWLAVQTWPEAGVLCAMSWIDAVVAPVGTVVAAGNWVTWLFYLPCTAMILTRPNIDTTFSFTEIKEVLWVSQPTRGRLSDE